MTYKKKSPEELRKALSPLSYEVTQNAATEAPFSGQHWDRTERGLYVDITTGEPLFSSRDWFNAGCGWPSFAAPIEPERLTEHEDTSLGRVRTEVRSRDSDSHLGHVFTDGPSQSGGLRYCINSAALRFIPLAQMKELGYEKYIDKV